jgi:hypothetical protein
VAGDETAAADVPVGVRGGDDVEPDEQAERHSMTAAVAAQ